MDYLFSELIKIKRSKKELSEKQIQFMINEYSLGNIPDYQMASMLMAIFLNGLNKKETLFLTQAMLKSGKEIVFDDNNFYVDKHSSGGVGDKTSIILTSIVACVEGVKVPMISGRGLGHTGGTLDKLESIPGFVTRIEIDKFKENVKNVGASIIGQTSDICPADKKMYALRDVTGTIESLPLICASIMSKKLAEGINGLVLDVKCGSGAFMKNMKDAENLAKGLKNIGLGAKKKMSVLITDMNQPLGRYAGNSLEIIECIDIMKNKKHIVDGRDMYQDTRELSVRLAAEMLLLAKAVKNLDEGIKKSESILKSGEAFNKFRKIIVAHLGFINMIEKPKYSVEVLANKSGFLESFNTEQIGLCGILLKAGREKESDQIDPTSGIEFFKKIGDKVSKGQVIFKLWSSDKALLKKHKDYLSEAFSLSSKKVSPPSLIIKKI